MSGGFSKTKDLPRMNLAEQAAFFSSVPESSTEHTIVTKGLDGTITAWSEGARRIYGYNLAEVVGRSAMLLHDQEDVKSERGKAFLEKARKAGRWEGRIRRVWKDGSFFSAQVTMTLRQDGEAQGGRVELWSVSGTGGIFTALLPRALAPKDLTNRAPGSDAPRSLVLEENPVSRDLARASLDSLGLKMLDTASEVQAVIRKGDAQLDALLGALREVLAFPKREVNPHVS